MIGLDTNVLLRVFIEDDPAQSERARRLVRRATAEGRVLINSIVLSEFAWTLARTFKLGRLEIARLLAELLSADDLEFERREAAKAALDAYRAGEADFPDYYLAEVNAGLGCASTATFDRAALKHSRFSSVP
ncbi:MAG TPA: type II toxin-antitoxin system VapC family toxin [Roseiarcus sp.]|nr:type II toxin-antitoxin system VapC family toxin [Roseiarcus sp.]